MSKVHITQCLCPNRHCIAALAWEEPDFTSESAIAKLRDTINEAVSNNIIHHRCAICQSTDLSYEDGITRFECLREAMDDIAAVQVENLRTKRMLDVLKN
jgi:hypothetical protein